MFKRDSTTANPKNRTDTAKPDQHQYGLGPVRMTNVVQQQQRKARTHYLVKDAEIPDIIIDNRHRKKYTKLGFLGEGGFARVYQVKSMSGNYFAAKVIGKKSLINKKMKTKMLAEVNIHRSLRHNSIVQYVNCFEDKMNVYIIMELCENGTLTDLIRRRRTITEDECRYLLGQILLAIRHMHANRIIHRDLKLSNIFLNKDMDPKIGDFGLAALLVKETDRKKTVCGTPNYIAPEILFGCHAHNQVADMWSFGVLMYTLLIGQHPFYQHDAKLIFKKVEENGTSSSYSYPISSTISSEAKHLISHLLVNNPDNRYTVSDALNHPFFSENRIPDRIPTSALRLMPTQDEMFTNYSQQSNHASKVASMLEKAKKSNIFNEIDPINQPLKILKETILDPRIQYTSTQQQDLASKQTDLKRHDSSSKQERDASSSKRTRLGDKTNTASQDKNTTLLQDKNTTLPKSRTRTATASTSTTTSTNTSENTTPTNTSENTPTTNPTSAAKSTNTPSKENSKSSHYSLMPKPKRIAELYLSTGVYGPSLMASMVHNLLSAINEHTLNVFSGRYDTNPITVDESIWCGDNIFLQGWVDFTALCGVGYMLSDNTVGIYFNDTITMTSHDDLEFYYTYRNENNAPQEGIFDLNHVPPKFKDGAHIKRDVSKKISFLGDMRKYMKSNLAMASLEHHNDTQVTTGIHLTKYIVTDDAIIFRLNNGVIQVNMFNSHKKLVLYSKGTKIIYIDTDQTVAHFNILEALAHGDEELSDIIYKLADVLEQQVNVKY